MHIICLFVASIKDAGKKFQLANVKDVNYRIEETPSESKNVSNNHAYEYDANGNLVYVNTSRTKKDGVADEKTAERKLKWDEENRLLASDDNGFVTNYWYDADGERTVKTSGESDQVYVNSEFAGGRTNTAKFSLYVSPYLVANQGGRYTKHIYIGSQRVVSKIGDFDSYGSDPRRIQYAGSETDGLSVDYKVKYTQQLQVIKDNYAIFAVPYNGEDNNDYVDGKGFCCNDGSLEAAQAQALARAAKNNFQEGDSYEKMQFYYHPDHLGSSSYITNLEGEVVQHIEYVPFGEVFVEERNNIWNTPYLFNAKEFDEETGLYYYGARYYDPRISLWISTDPLEEDYPNIISYGYCHNSPVTLIDPNGEGDYYAQDGTYLATDRKKDNYIYVQYQQGKTNLTIGRRTTSFQKLDISKTVFLAFASAVNTESSGNLKESMALGNTVVNYLNAGGSKNIKTLEDVVLHKNSFMRGAKQDNYTMFRKLSPERQNAKYAIKSVLNAIAYNQGLAGFSDYSHGANTWDGKDLMYVNWINSHRNYIWSSDSKGLIKQYHKLVNGDVKLNVFKYSEKPAKINIRAVTIAGNTLFTHLYGGRGEKKTGNVFR